MLEHDHILLALLVLHLLLKGSTKSVKRSAASLNRLRAEKTDPSQTRDDAAFFALVRGLNKLDNLGNKGAATRKTMTVSWKKINFE